MDQPNLWEFRTGDKVDGKYLSGKTQQNNAHLAL